MLNKNIIILTIVLFALIAALGLMFLFGKNTVIAPAPIIKSVTVKEINKNIADLNNFDAVLALSAQDDIVVQELDTTLNEVGEISAPPASLSSDEENLSNLDSNLSNLSADEKINQEIDQSLRGVSL